MASDELVLIGDLNGRIEWLRSKTDDQEKRIRRLEKLLFDMALPKAIEPAGAVADEEYFRTVPCGCGSETCGCVPHMLDGGRKR